MRVPDHPVALALLRALGTDKGLAAPSANRFGRISLTAVAHVQAEFGAQLDMILDGGPCRVGLESTIIGNTGKMPVLLHPGGIPIPALEEALGQKIAAPGAAPSVRVSGSLASHYAPATPLEVWPGGAMEQRFSELAGSGRRIALMVLSTGAVSSPDSPQLFRHPMPPQATDYARQLYATLRQLDGAHFDRILAEAPPQTADWQAVHDRLRRAAALYCPDGSEDISRK